MKRFIFALLICITPYSSADEPPMHTMSDLLEMDQAELVVHVNELYQEIHRLRADLANAQGNQAQDEEQSNVPPVQRWTITVDANERPDMSELQRQHREADREFLAASRALNAARNNERIYEDSARHRDIRVQAEARKRDAQRLLDGVLQEIERQRSRRLIQATTSEGRSVELILAGVYLQDADSFEVGSVYTVEGRVLNGHGGIAFRGFVQPNDSE